MRKVDASEKPGTQKRTTSLTPAWESRHDQSIRTSVETTDWNEASKRRHRFSGGGCGISSVATSEVAWPWMVNRDVDGGIKDYSK